MDTDLRRARAFMAQPLKKGHAWSELHYAYDYQEDDMYLGWFDDNPKHTHADRIGGAIAAFVARYGTHPTVVLVNEDELVQVAGVDVRSESYIRRNNVWVGMVQP